MSPDSQELARDTTDSSDSFVATLADVDELRRLTIPQRDGQFVQSATLTVLGYERPSSSWGRPPELAGRIAAFQVTWPETVSGTVTIEIRLRYPTALSEVARAVAAFLMPHRGSSASSSLAVAVEDGTSDEVLAFLPSPWAPQPAQIKSSTSLPGNDVVIVNSDVTDPTSQHYSFVRFHEGPVLVSGKHSKPIVDIHIHNPLGRPQPGPSVEDGRASLWLRGDRMQIAKRNAEDGVIADFDLLAPVDRQIVRDLRSVSSLSLGELNTPSSPDFAAALSCRLAELAATGALLHSGAHLESRLSALSSGLRAQLSAGSVPTGGLLHSLRSGFLVREALREHSGLRVLSEKLYGGHHSDFTPAVTALIVTRRPERVVEALKSMSAQTYPLLEILVVTHGFQVDPEPSDLDNLAPAKFFEVGRDVPFGEALAVGTSRASGSLIAKIDDDDLYGPEHIWDLVLARHWSGAEIVGKHPEYVYLAPLRKTIHRRYGQHEYTRRVAGGSILASIADIASVGGWRPIPRAVDRALFERVLADGGLIYATQATGFVYVRHQDGHTWDTSLSTFFEGAFEEWDGPNEAILEVG